MTQTFNKSHNCDRLWRIWYCITVSAVNMYLIYHGVSRYLLFKSQVFNPRYGGQWSEAPMNGYLAFLVLAAALLPPFIYATIFKVGNQANDGSPFGRETDDLYRNSLLKLTLKGMNTTDEESTAHHHDDVESHSDLNTSNQGKLVSKMIWIRIRRHFLPSSCILHLITAYLLLAPLPLLQAEQIRNEALPRENVWLSDLNLFLPDHGLIVKEEYVHRTHLQPIISPESVNYMIALVILALRFPNQFWYTSQRFSILFSMIILLAGVQLVFEFAASAVTIKITYNIDLFSTKSQLPIIPILSPWIITTLTGFAFLLTLMAIVIVYEYGHGHFLRGVESYRQLGATTMSASSASQLTQSTDHCDSSWPCVCLLFISIILIVLRVPLISQCIHVRQFESSLSILLPAVIATVVVTVFWLLLWFTFTIKTHWDFIINVPYLPRNSPLTSVSKTMATNSQLQNNNGPAILPSTSLPGEPVYGCFHDVIPPSYSSAASSAIGDQNHYIYGNRLQMDGYSDSSRNSGNVIRVGGNLLNFTGAGVGGSHYVQLHHVTSISENVDGGGVGVIGGSNGGDAQGNGYLKNSTSQGSLRALIEPPYASLASLRNIGITSGGPRNLNHPNEFDSPGGLSADQLIEMGGGGNDLLSRGQKIRASRNRVTFKETDAGGGGGFDTSTSLLGDSSNGGGSGMGSPPSLHTSTPPNTDYFNNFSKTNNQGGGCEDYEDYRMFRHMFNNNVNAIVEPDNGVHVARSVSSGTSVDGSTDDRLCSQV